VKKLFARNKYLSIALALGAFVAVGPAPAFAQAGGYSGGPLAIHYNADGSKASGWTVEAASVRPVAHAASTKKSGLTAYAAIGDQRATDYYNTVPSSLGPADRFGGASQR
jgi:hypothetical protein